MSQDFMAKARKAKESRPAPAVKGAAETFNNATPRKEPVHRTTINIPLSIHEQMRREAFETGISMTDQIINAWKQERGML